jgi:molybdate transport system ATP-binding protein
VTELSVELRLEAASRGFAFDVRFEAPPGITVLHGPSGAGKSTTLCMIAGILRPSEGRIALGEEVWLDTRAQIDRPIEARRIAYVFQSLALFPHLDAIDNVAYGIDAGLRGPERKERARSWLAKMKVEHVAARRPRTYSGGEAQRVALARAFAMAPRLVLLDEAFSSLDRPLREALNQDVRRLIEAAKIPAIQVTHDRDEARAMGDRLIHLERGTIVVGPSALSP